ncbi:MAG: outer membrane beta-barrel protein [Rikenellaceae bacterium]
MDKDKVRDKELSELIKETIAGYEEEYVAGAWENFVNKRKRRKKIIYLRFAAGVAASILLWLLGLNIYDKEQPASTTSPYTNPTQSTQEISVDSSIPDKVQTVAKKILASNRAISPTTRSYANINKLETAVSFEITTKRADSVKAVFNTSPTTDSTRGSRVAESIIDQKKEANQIKTEQSKRKVKFGINVAQGINSTSTASSHSYSGGVNIDIPLIGQLQLSTGLQVEHQSVVSKKSDGNSAIPADRNRASLINLDFPLNITWKFFSRKSNSYYISGGISSLAYLSEKYTTTSYKQEVKEAVTLLGTEEARTYKLENVETTTTHSGEPSNAFDIAGRINISLGIEKQLSPKLYLHVEPYLKIPVSGLATENLKFTTSGIICKISF